MVHPGFSVQKACASLLVSRTFGFGLVLMVFALALLAHASTYATGVAGFAGQFSCQDQYTCDYGTISVTVHNTTKTINYDGTGFYTGTGFSSGGSPGIPQTIAQTLVDAFNNDSSSPVTATLIQDTYLPGYTVGFTAKQAGVGGNYSTSITVTSAYGNFQVFGSATIAWTLTAHPSTGGADPAYLTESSPISGALSGGS